MDGRPALRSSGLTMRLTVSDVAGRHLDQWADALMRGELQIWQLPPQVQQFVSIGWADGNARARQQAREYEHLLDRAYIWAFTDKDRREEYLRRLDEHFRAEAEQFFAEPEVHGPAANERRAA